MWILALATSCWQSPPQKPHEVVPEVSVSEAPVRERPTLLEVPEVPSPTVGEAKRQLAAYRTEAALDDPIARARALGTPEAVFSFVRDAIVTEAYRGQLRGPAGALASRAGNDVDKALLLIAMETELGARADLCRADDAPPIHTSRRIGEPDAFALANGEALDGWTTSLTSAIGAFPATSREAGPRWRVRLDVDGITRVVDPTEPSATFRGGQLDGCTVMSLPPEEVHRVFIRSRCGALNLTNVERPAAELFGASVLVEKDVGDCGLDELIVDVTVESPGRPPVIVRRNVPQPEVELLVVVGTGPLDGRARLRAEVAKVDAIVQGLGPETATVDDQLRAQWSGLGELRAGVGDPREGLAPLVLLDRIVRTGDIFGLPVVVDGPNVSFVALGVDGDRYANVAVGTYALDAPVRSLGATAASSDRMRVGSAGLFVGFDVLSYAGGRAGTGEARGRLAIDATNTGSAFARARAESRTWLPVDINEVDRVFLTPTARSEARAAIAAGAFVVAPDGLADDFGGDAFLAIASTGDVAERRFSAAGGPTDPAVAAACVPVVALTVDQAARDGACAAEEPQFAAACALVARVVEVALAERSNACNATLGLQEAAMDRRLPQR